MNEISVVVKVIAGRVISKTNTPIIKRRVSVSESAFPSLLGSSSLLSFAY